MAREGEQAQWRLAFLEARVAAAERADEVLAVLRRASTQQDGVAALMSLLAFDGQVARGVLDNWGACLSLEDRARAVAERDQWKAVLNEQR